MNYYRILDHSATAACLGVNGCTHPKPHWHQWCSIWVQDLVNTEVQAGSRSKEMKIMLQVPCHSNVPQAPLLGSQLMLSRPSGLYTLHVKNNIALLLDRFCCLKWIKYRDQNSHADAVWLLSWPGPWSLAQLMAALAYLDKDGMFIVHSTVISV